jgi:CheY-like chemotaxis protein
MTRILVVDDSAVDRRLIEGLLRGQSGWKVEHAENGHQALARVKASPPDIIISDLIMPEMDGLQLVAELKQNHPQIPVVIVTGRGCEWMAVKALHRGAASYAPKSKLAEILVEAIRQVLDMVESDRSYQRVIGGLLETTYDFRLESDPLLIAPLVKLFQQLAYALQLCDAAGRNQLGVALDEALLNAMFHGNLELPRVLLPETRAAVRMGVTHEIIRQRLGEAPYKQRSVFVSASVTRQQARFVIRDEGAGFDTTRIPEAGDASTLRDDGGRGLVLIKNLIEEVHFNDGGREVVLVTACPKSHERSPALQH